LVKKQTNRFAVTIKEGNLLKKVGNFFCLKTDKNHKDAKGGKKSW
jgi:hypothetical protein